MNAMNLYPFVLPSTLCPHYPFTLVVNGPPALPVWLLFGDLHIPSTDFAGAAVAVTREHSQRETLVVIKTKTLPCPLGTLQTTEPMVLNKR